MTNVPPSDGGAVPDPASPDSPSPVALAATETPVELRVALVEDDRTPEGMVCMGTYRGDRLIARCVLPPAAWAQIEEYGLFDEPVPVVLVARESPPGLQCQLFAMVPVPDLDDEDVEEEEESDEPWAASVPGAGYEAAIAEEAALEDEDEEDEEEEDDAGVTPLPLGNIVRYERDRVHPDSLPHEAADVLMKIIEGKTSEVVDRALADLLGL
ncbi:MAG TPA: hypothetical protein VFZ13_10815 [Gemmatimonadales bacterium]